MTAYQNRLRAFTFSDPAWIPFRVIITEQAWLAYPQEELKKLVTDHPLTFGDIDTDDIDVAGMPTIPWRDSSRDYRDSWGALWRTVTDGMTGTVIEHPLAAWDSWNTVSLPDPDRENGWGEVDWNSLAENFRKAKRLGTEPPAMELRHGHTFLTLVYLRGFENLVYDMFDEEPRLRELIGAIESFNLRCLHHLMEAGPDIVGFPEDLGSQNNSLISPELFRKYIKPSYRRLMAVPKLAGKIVHMHCDGWILNLVDDLIDCGVEVLNIQDMIHGIDELKRCVDGRIALELDVDRQNVTVFGSQADIRGLIREEVEKLSSPSGGLALLFEIRPPVDLENVRVLCSAMEEFSGIKSI